MHRLALCLILISSTPLSETIIDQARRNRAIHSPAAPTLHEDSHGMHAQVALEAACALTPMGLEQQALKTSLSRELETSRPFSSHLIKTIAGRRFPSFAGLKIRERLSPQFHANCLRAGGRFGGRARLGTHVHSTALVVPVVLHILGLVCECGRVDVSKLDASRALSCSIPIPDKPLLIYSRVPFTATQFPSAPNLQINAGTVSQRPF